jgi:hypothetical protein
LNQAGDAQSDKKGKVTFKYELKGLAKDPESPRKQTYRSV